ncbi:MAG: peptidoglycan editing factor PgeF [Muribaculaceae bacterium]
MNNKSIIEMLPFASQCEEIVTFSTLRGIADECNDPYPNVNVCDYTGDAYSHIADCRRQLCEELGIDESCLIMPRQTHSAKVEIIDDNFMALDADERKLRLQGVDALVTSLRGVVIGVNTADCVPVVLRDSIAGIIGVAHAGWKGTVARIAAATVEAMLGMGAKADKIEVAIGPSICPECFEVGDEVVEQFVTAGFDIARIMQRNKVTGKAHIDLWEANTAVLEDVGVNRGKIALSHRCTRCNVVSYFSARRLGIASGRTFTAIMMKNK